MLKKIFLIFALTILSYSASPRPIIQVSYHLGGDELITIDHDYKADYTIDAGDGFNFELGMAIEDPQGGVEIQLLAGYKFDSDSADNGDMTWDMFPLSALGFIKIPYWKFGGGLTYHLNPKLRGGFGKDNINDRFKDALGAIAQIQYEPIDSVAIGLRATFIEYKLERDSSQTANGNSVGLVCTIKFGSSRVR